MGKFELTTTFDRDFNPETCKLTIVCSCTKSGTMGSVRDFVLSELGSLKDEIDALELPNISVSFDNFYIRSVQNENGNRKVFGKGKTEEVFTAGIRMYVDFDELSSVSAENLAKVIELISNIDMNIVTSAYDVGTEIPEHLEDSLRVELAKKCRGEADSIVKGLGGKITGIETVCYNSSGSLLKLSSSSMLKSANRVATDSCFLAECSEFDASVTGDLIDEPDKSSGLAEGIVEGILGSKVHKVGVISVVFNIGMD